MEHLQTYNESIRDKMTPKELTGRNKIFFDANKDIKSIGLETNFIGKEKGEYILTITNILNTDIKVYFHDFEEMKKYNTDEYIKKFESDWYIYIYTTIDGTNERRKFKANTWDEMFIIIINICYPNIDSIIKKTESRIEEFERYLTSNKDFIIGLKKAK